MNELETKLSGYLDTLAEAAKGAVDQAPIVIQEFINWEIYSNLAIGGLFAVAAMIVSLLSVIGMIRADGEEDKTGYMVILAIAILIGGGAASIGLFTAGKAYVAPRVVVLEKIAELAK